MKSILIIDDEKAICESIKMILEYEGYHVNYSTSPVEGLQNFLSNQYSAMLLDIQMPEMNGFEVLKKAKENNS
ncbi:MAG TPA: response regulator, partial [Ignavibacteriaceae bacterium]|nr:response regulator [Ignavibacteriaceae bacterium]